MKDLYISSSLKLALAKKYNIHISEVTKDFLKSLTEIDLPGNNIKDIKGIEFAINATYVNLTRNNIYDASCLGKLSKLINLELNENKIEDISFIKKLKKLKSIGLESNNIKILPNLNNANLSMINLDNNKILNISNLNNSNFKNTTILASDQCVILDPIEVEFGKNMLFTSNIRFGEEIVVFLDNVQVNGTYDRIYTDEKPSILYSISEIIITGIKSNCILTMEFYHEESHSFPRILSGTLIQPINLISKNNDFLEINKLTAELELSNIHGCIKLNSSSTKPKYSNLFFYNKVVTLIYESGKTVYTSINEQGEYKFDNIPIGKYTLLFPVLSEYTYIEGSVYILNIKNKEEYVINTLTELNKK